MVSEPQKHCKGHKSHFRTKRDRREDRECHINQSGTTDPCCILTPASFRSSLQSFPWGRMTNRRSPCWWQGSQDVEHVTPHLPPPCIAVKTWSSSPSVSHSNIPVAGGKWSGQRKWLTLHTAFCLGMLPSHKKSERDPVLTLNNLSVSI